MRNKERKGFQRLESEQGYFLADLTVTPSDEGGRGTDLASGCRANWRLPGTDAQYSASITIEGRDLLAPGENAVVRVHPTFPRAWPVIEAGSKLRMLEGLRTVGTALVLEVVPPSFA